ncbi:Hypothetical predicted protein [Mytilus galloprovincialis]|uniref:MULE transposase domain-containing protein n=1 Tax=Mytilus galloprovincialis TaxID=29158 RepID=A0A8B6BVG4_MYTGA|nr:Hypothetical predicted protein [Mytilus galloprovincialis]
MSIQVNQVLALLYKLKLRSNRIPKLHQQPTSAIVKRAMRTYADPTAPEASRPNPNYLVRTGNRIRQSERPSDPTHLDAELEYDFLTQNAPNFILKDLTVGNNRHLIFYTDRQLQLLARAKTWYMDGTFRVVNHPWEQLFSIHAFVKSGYHMKQIPLVFCVMSGKSKKDYYQTASNQKDSVYTFLRQLMALPFLPSEHITDTFLQLDARAPQAIVPVMNYVYSTWIDSTIFEIHH